MAACQGHRTPEQTITLCAWVNGTRTLLPETDRVILVDERLPEEDQVVDEPTWSELRQRYHDRMELTEHWPARWRLST